MSEHIDYRPTVYRLDTGVNEAICREPYDTMWWGMGNAKADRLIDARDAHLKAALVHAQLATARLWWSPQSPTGDTEARGVQ